MHNKKLKLRYIAASHTCTTSDMAKTVTKCLKLVLRQHRLYCRVIERRTQVKRMWIIDNSESVLQNTEMLKEEHTANIYIYDFSTLYTNIPHEDLKHGLKWVVEKVFSDSPNKRMYVNKHGASWRKSKGKKNKQQAYSKEEILNMIYFLIDNSFIKVGNHIFKQIRGISMGTSCSPFLANLYLYALEFDFLDKLTKSNIHEARKFRHMFRYIDDLLCLNNDKLLSKYIHEIYPKELILNRTNEHEKACTFLDINMDIRERQIHTQLYDKRDDFKFQIVSFPQMSGNIHFKRTHGVFVSQLIRYSRVYMDRKGFMDRTKRLAKQLIRQGFAERLLKIKFSYFFDKHFHLVEKYDISKKECMQHIFL